MHKQSKLNLVGKYFVFNEQTFSRYFQDGLETLQHFGGYIQVLSVELQKIRQKQDEERRRLIELRNLLRSAPGIDKDVRILKNGPANRLTSCFNFSVFQ